MHTKRSMRRGPVGFYGVVVDHPKHEVNVGTLWRSAFLYDAAFIGTIGRRYDHQASDTPKTPRRIPMVEYSDIEDLKSHLPWGTPLVGVELDDRAVPLEKFYHPPTAVYILGAEDHGLSRDVLNACHKIVKISSPKPWSMNMAVAGSLVLSFSIRAGAAMTDTITREVAELEEWRDIPGFEGYYQVSSLGRVRSVDRMVPWRFGRKRLAKGVVLSPRIGTGGYGSVNLRRGSLLRTERVHVLVAEAFLGPRPDGCYALHGNGDPGDNRSVNLRWGTPSENGRDAVNHGRNRGTQKKRCPRGHLLIEPNLRESVARSTGRRECRSCYNAFCWRWHHENKLGENITDSEWLDYANAQYRQIMELSA